MGKLTYTFDHHRFLANVITNNLIVIFIIWLPFQNPGQQSPVNNLEYSNGVLSGGRNELFSERGPKSFTPTLLVENEIKIFKWSPLSRYWNKSDKSTKLAVFCC